MPSFLMVEHQLVLVVYVIIMHLGYKESARPIRSSKQVGTIKSYDINQCQEFTLSNYF